MGLLSKTAMVKWNSSNKNYYGNKGYMYTKMGDEFEVKVEDLSNGTNTVYVDVQCDCTECTTPIDKPVIWQTYKQCVHEDGSYYCRNCALRLYGTEKMRKSKLKEDATFGYWLIKNLPLKQAIEIISRWDEEKNKCDIRDVGYASNKKIYFKCPKGIHPSEQKNINGFTSNNQKGSLDCNMCQSFAQWGYDNIDSQFLEKYWDYSKNIDKKGNPIDPWKISKGWNHKVWIFCQEKDYHGSYDINCNGFYRGNRCGYCNGKKVHKFDSLGWLYPQVFNIWSEKNEKSPYEYLPMSGKFVWWMCKDNKHKDYYRSISNSVIFNFRCPECVQEMDESIIQNKTRLYLESLNDNYQILHEGNCTLKPKNIIEPPNNNNKKRGKGTLRYDNEIIIDNKHLFIEVNGEQHEIADNYYNIKPTKKYNTTPEQELKYLQDRDEYKEQYVYNQGKNYYYLAVWYYDFDKENTYKKLINNKISQILNQL